MSETPTITDFAATGTIATFIVPQTGTYYIAAYGAQASAARASQFPPPPEGYALGYDGGFAGGNVSLTQGETLEIAVGQNGFEPGSSLGELFLYQGGGGGGSFVVLVAGSVDVPLIVAGGGGTEGPGGAVIGASGQGSSISGGGGGFYSDGASAMPVTTRNETVIGPFGGLDFADGLNGGGGFVEIAYPSGATLTGGLGGFGAGGGAGAGGGYTGGDPEEGGSSYVDTSVTDPLFAAGIQTGNGFVEITYPACFVAGTRIATPDGSRAVETLCVGDLVTSARRQRAVPVTWVGSRRVAFSTAPNPAWVCPVRITAGAFGRGQPARDLFLSPDHAVFAAGVLIPVRVLVNGDSVARHPVGAVTYWHVQLDEHDILLAEGLPVESFLDTRQMSAPGAASRIWEAAGCAPLHITGPEVDAVRARLSSLVAR